MPDSNIIVDAQWQINSYNITLNPGTGGTIVITIDDSPGIPLSTTANYNSVINIIPVPHVGYSVGSFVVTNADGSVIPTPDSSFVMPANDVTITGYFIANEYTITYMDGNTVLNVDTFTYRTAITPMANPTKEGYTFTGWNPELPTTMTAEDLTVNAQWQINSYNITLNPGTGGTIVITIDDSPGIPLSTTANYNSVINIIPVPHVGYSVGSFVVTNADGSVIPTPDSSFVMPANDVTITGYFIANESKQKSRKSVLMSSSSIFMRSITLRVSRLTDGFSVRMACSTKVLNKGFNSASSSSFALVSPHKALLATFTSSSKTYCLAKPRKSPFCLTSR